MSDAIGAIMAQIFAPPRPGIKAADLNDRERIALAYAAGVRLESELVGGMLQYRTAEPIAIGDRPGGGFIVTKRGPSNMEWLMRDECECELDPPHG